MKFQKYVVMLKRKGDHKNFDKRTRLKYTFHELLTKKKLTGNKPPTYNNDQNITSDRTSGPLILK